MSCVLCDAEVLRNNRFHHHPGLGRIFRRSASLASPLIHQTWVKSIKFQAKLCIEYAYAVLIYDQYARVEVTEVNWLRERVGFSLRDARSKQLPIAYSLSHFAPPQLHEGFVHSVVEFLDEKALKCSRNLQNVKTENPLVATLHWNPNDSFDLLLSDLKVQNLCSVRRWTFLLPFSVWTTQTIQSRAESLARHSHSSSIYIMQCDNVGYVVDWHANFVPSSFLGSSWQLLPRYLVRRSCLQPKTSEARRICLPRLKRRWSDWASSVCMEKCCRQKPNRGGLRDPAKAGCGHIAVGSTRVFQSIAKEALRGASSCQICRLRIHRGDTEETQRIHQDTQISDYEGDPQRQILGIQIDGDQRWQRNFFVNFAIYWPCWDSWVTGSDVPSPTNLGICDRPAKRFALVGSSLWKAEAPGWKTTALSLPLCILIWEALGFIVYLLYMPCIIYLWFEYTTACISSIFGFLRCVLLPSTNGDLHIPCHHEAIKEESPGCEGDAVRCWLWFDPRWWILVSCSGRQASNWGRNLSMEQRWVQSKSAWDGGSRKKGWARHPQKLKPAVPLVDFGNTGKRCTEQFSTILVLSLHLSGFRLLWRRRVMTSVHLQADLETRPWVHWNWTNSLKSRSCETLWQQVKSFWRLLCQLIQV